MFIVNSTRIDKETLSANVTYTLRDGTRIDIDVPLFAPQSLDEVLDGLGNREDSEQRTYDAVTTNMAIKAQMETEAIAKTFERVDGKVTVKKG